MKREVNGWWENSSSSLPTCPASVVAALPGLRCSTGGPLEGLVAWCTFPSWEQPAINQQATYVINDPWDLPSSGFSLRQGLAGASPDSYACVEIRLNILYKFGTGNASDFGGFVTTFGVGLFGCLHEPFWLSPLIQWFKSWNYSEPET